MLAWLPLLAFGCGLEATGQRIPADSLGYDFGRPDTILTLPRRLVELSGLTALSDTVLAAVEDESGTVYLLDARTGTLRDRFRFWGSGDYEDIQLRGDTLWILDSDGDLYRTLILGDRDDTERLETPLTARYDTEGLALDPRTGSLWIAAKEFPGPGLDGSRAVYAFDPDQERLRLDPVLIIDLEQVEEVRRDAGGGVRVLRRLLRKFGSGDRFRPSALEFVDGGASVLIVSSTSPILLHVARDGTILSAHGLPPDLHQPESITVAPDGTLYIGTEGGAGRARIAVYRKSS